MYKIELGKRDMEAYNSYEKNSKIIAKKDFEAWQMEYSELKNDFANYLKENNAVSKNNIMDEIIRDVTDIEEEETIYDKITNVLADLVKWLTHWIVVPTYVGSIPTIRPRLNNPRTL